jgi:hypothetical protein
MRTQECSYPVGSGSANPKDFDRPPLNSLESPSIWLPLSSTPQRPSRQRLSSNGVGSISLRRARFWIFERLVDLAARIYNLLRAYPGLGAKIKFSERFGLKPPAEISER